MQSRNVVSGRGSHGSEEQPDPGVGTNRQPAGSTEGSRLFLGLCVWCGLPESEGKAAALIMPVCNTAAMNHHLSEISSQVATDAHAVVILDRAGWHRSQGLVVPGNITLLELRLTARSSIRLSGFGHGYSAPRNMLWPATEQCSNNGRQGSISALRRVQWWRVRSPL